MPDDLGGRRKRFKREAAAPADQRLQRLPGGGTALDSLARRERLENFGAIPTGNPNHPEMRAVNVSPGNVGLSGAIGDALAAIFERLGLTRDGKPKPKPRNPPPGSQDAKARFDRRDQIKRIKRQINE